MKPKNSKAACKYLAGLTPLILFTNLAMAGAEFASNSNKDVTIRDESQPWITASVAAGYDSTYMFRGTNLTPDSSGLTFEQLNVTAYGFTLGTWFGQQLGESRVEDARAIGESGGVGPVTTTTVTQSSVPLAGTTNAESTTNTTRTTTTNSAVQKQFKELDLYAAYTHSFGPVDVGVGDLAFLIFRDAFNHVMSDSSSIESRIISSAGGKVLESTSFPATKTRTRIALRTIGNEQFDRIFLSLSTSKIPFVVPVVRYYQTLYSDGQDPQNLRSNRLGGYLEAELKSSIPLYKDVVSLDPYFLAAYSTGDRTDSSGKALYGWDNVQVGIELPVRLTRYLTVSLDGNFSHRLSSPPVGTQNDDWWGGGKVAISF